jgi:L-asparaginase II
MSLLQENLKIMSTSHSPEVLIEVTRGSNGIDHVENIHYGSIAVVDATGKLLHYAGDPAWMTFSRSTIKPFQATPFMTDGGMAEFKLSLQEVALLCYAQAIAEKRSISRA